MIYELRMYRHGLPEWPSRARIHADSMLQAIERLTALFGADYTLTSLTLIP